MLTEKLALIVTGDSKSAVNALKDVGKTADVELGKAEARGKKTSTGLKQGFDQVGVGAAVGGAAIVKFGLSAVNAYEASAKVGAQTNAVLISTGNVANVTSGHVNSLANSISRKTGIDDEAIQSGENLLLTFTNIRNEAGKGNDVFDQATQATTDLSAALGQDMKSSAIQVGKALNDPIKGVTALQRVGVSFTASQRDQIKTLVSTGHTLEAQKLIIKELKTEFGGAAEAMATPMDKLRVSVNNFQESLGGIAAPQVESFAKILTFAATGATKASDSTNTYGRVAAGILTLGGSEILPKFWEAVEGKTKGAADVAKEYQNAQKKVADLIAQGKQGTDEFKTAQSRLNDAQARAKAITKGLAAAQGDLGDNSISAALAEQQAAAETDSAKLSADIATGAVLSLAQAFQILGSSAVAGASAAGTVGSLTSAAFAQFDATNSAASSLDAYNKSLVDTSAASGGAGGATKNLSQAFYDHEQKLTAVRDATQAVGDAQVDLARSQRASKEAFQDLTKAASAYNDIIHGVNAKTKTGKGAASDLEASKDARKRAQLDVVDAENNLKTARKGGNAREITVAELDLREARRRNTEATTAATEAQRVYDGTIHGFAKDSTEAKDAQNQLTSAYDSAYDSITNVREATDSAHDSATALAHAADDLAGKLDSITTGGSQAQVRSLTDRLNEQKTAAAKLAQDVGTAVAQATGSVGKGVDAEINTLKAIIDTNPRLKGAFDGVLLNLERELNRYLQTSGTASPVTPRRNYDVGGWVDAPAGVPVAATVHGGEFVLSRDMIRNAHRSASRSGGGSVTHRYDISIVNPHGDAKQIANTVLDAIEQGHAKQRYVRTVKAAMAS